MTKEQVIRALLDELDECCELLRERVTNADASQPYTIGDLGSALEHADALFKAITIVSGRKEKE